MRWTWVTMEVNDHPLVRLLMPLRGH
jgi:hypothetical protein